jgi:choice-of-anchor A domain-containing protein
LAAHAGGSAAAGLQDLEQLNLIVLGSPNGVETLSDDVIGRAFIGESVSGTFTAGTGNTSYPGVSSAYPTLTVEGNIDGTVNLQGGVTPAGLVATGSVGTLNVNTTDALVQVGGTIGTAHTSGSTLQQNDSGLAATVGGEQSALAANLTALSTTLEGLAPTSAADYLDTSNTNSGSIVLGDTSGAGYVVIDTTASALESLSDLSFAIPSGVTVVMNVQDDVTGPIEVDANENDETEYASDLIWNFEGATNISFNRQFDGAVLAPDATVSNASPLEGAIAVAQLDQGGEIHLPTLTPSGGLAGAVPEPATWTMTILGAGLIGAVLRRRRSPQPA